MLPKFPIGRAVANTVSKMKLSDPLKTAISFNGELLIVTDRIFTLSKS